MAGTVEKEVAIGVIVFVLGNLALLFLLSQFPGVTRFVSGQQD